MRSVFLIISLCWTIQLCCQSQADFWYFGNGIGIDFKVQPPIIKTDGAMTAPEGCATISHPLTGNLLFYTNGDSVWNSMHQVMPNGSDLIGYMSSIQSSVIVPTPCDSNSYYLFTSDGETPNPPYSIQRFPNDSIFGYSLIDMSLGNGLGDLKQKNIKLMAPVNENVGAVQHTNGIYTWVVAREHLSNFFHSYLITENGIEHHISSDVGTIGKTPSSIKFSAKGDAFAFGHPNLQIFAFDDETGKISPTPYKLPYPSYGYGISQNGRFLYTTYNQRYLLQYDLEVDPAQFGASCDTLYKSRPYGFGNNKYFQSTPDGRIFISDALHRSRYLRVINSPNVKGINCNYDSIGIYLGHPNKGGLPNFIESYFNPEWKTSLSKPLNASFLNDTVCLGDTVYFSNLSTGNYIKTYWDFGDNFTSKTNHPKHFYSNAGDYFVKLRIDDCGNYDEITKNVFVRNCDIHILEFPNTFSPNGDGINELFQPVKLNGVESLNFQIFNRWGVLVYSSEDLNFYWDGTFNGVDCSEGTYYWIVNYSTRNEEDICEKGFLTLFR